MMEYIVYIRRRNKRIESLKVCAYSTHDAKRIVRKKLRTETFVFVRVELISQ